jgi:hypothetical protein
MMLVSLSRQSGAITLALGASIFAALIAPAQAQSQGSAPVTITGPLPLPITGTTSLSGPISITGTLSTRDVDNPARSPFQATLCTSGSFLSSTPPGCSNLDFKTQVPSNRRMVIEYVSGECSVGGAVGFIRLGISTTVAGVGADHRLHLQQDPLDSRFFDITQQKRLYADPGTFVGLGGSAGSAGANPGSYRCTVTLSGYTVAL